MAAACAARVKLQDGQQLRRIQTQIELPLFSHRSSNHWQEQIDTFPLGSFSCRSRCQLTPANGVRNPTKRGEGASSRPSRPSTGDDGPGVGNQNPPDAFSTRLVHPCMREMNRCGTVVGDMFSARHRGRRCLCMHSVAHTATQAGITEPWKLGLRRRHVLTGVQDAFSATANGRFTRTDLSERRRVQMTPFLLV